MASDIWMESTPISFCHQSSGNIVSEINDTDGRHVRMARIGVLDFRLQDVRLKLSEGNDHKDFCMRSCPTKGAKGSCDTLFQVIDRDVLDAVIRSKIQDDD